MSWLSSNQQQSSQETATAHNLQFELSSAGVSSPRSFSGPGIDFSQSHGTLCRYILHETMRAYAQQDCQRVYYITIQDVCRLTSVYCRIYDHVVSGVLLRLAVHFLSETSSQIAHCSYLEAPLPWLPHKLGGDTGPGGFAARRGRSRFFLVCTPYNIKGDPMPNHIYLHAGRFK